MYDGSTMKGKLIVGLIIAAVVIAAVCIVIVSVNKTDNAPSNSGGENSSPVSDIVIYSYEEFSQNAIACLTTYTTKIATTGDLYETIEGKMVIFDEDWISMNSNKSAINELIREAYNGGKPVLFLGSDNYLYKGSDMGLSTPNFAENSTGYGVFKDKGGVYHSYVSNGEDGRKATVDETLIDLYTWASTF